MSSPRSKFPSFRLATFNVLVQKFIDEEKYPNSSSEHKSWPFRWQLFEKTVTNFRADVLCLQEVQEDLFKSHWHPFLNKLGLEAHFQNKPKWGNVIAFNPNVFSLQWLDSRSRIMIACLRCLANDHLVYVANVHLIAHPERVEDQTNMIKSLMKQLEKHQKSLNLGPDSFSTIVCGDFNSSPDQGIYKLFSEGVLRADFRDLRTGIAYTSEDVRLPCGFTSAYFEHFKAEPAWTMSLQERNTLTLDYIFCSTNRLDVVLAEEIKCEAMSKNIPDAVAPSDHLPVVAEIAIRVSPIRRMLKNSA